MAEMESMLLQRRETYLRLALSLAEKSPLKPSNFRVGAVLVDEAEDKILSTGYTLELPGNTHAEQCCLLKLASESGVPEEGVADILPPNTAIYTTMEPCGKRLSGSTPCVDRILKTRAGKHGGISTVYLGVQEPKTFIGQNEGRSRFEAAGIKCVHVSGMEEDILRVATAGHDAVSEG